MLASEDGLDGDSEVHVAVMDCIAPLVAPERGNAWAVMDATVQHRVPTERKRGTQAVASLGRCTSTGPVDEKDPIDDLVNRAI